MFVRFDGCCALELRAGIGLCSIVLGRVAQHVLCTGKLQHAFNLQYAPKWGNIHLTVCGLHCCSFHQLLTIINNITITIHVYC